jgi:hypothetical protein
MTSWFYNICTYRWKNVIIILGVYCYSVCILCCCSFWVFVNCHCTWMVTSSYLYCALCCFVRCMCFYLWMYVSLYSLPPGISPIAVNNIYIYIYNVRTRAILCLFILQPQMSQPYQLLVMKILRDKCEASMKWSWQGKRKYSERNIPQYHFVRSQLHMNCLRIEVEHQQVKALFILKQSINLNRNLTGEVRFLVIPF